MMRDKRKNSDYFNRYIDFEKKRIATKKAKISDATDKTKVKRTYNNLFLYQINVLIASFSSGEDEGTLRALLCEACSTALELDALTYADALTLTSLSIMLHSTTQIKKVITKFQRLYEGDKLLFGLSTYIETGNAKWTGKYRFPIIYSGLEAFFAAKTSEAKEDVLLVFLKTWYEKCGDCSWYGTLENPNEVYYGYWCFEAAALSVIYNLNKQHLSKSEFYPMI